ncbi:MAG: GHKL domain-containing protein [Oscillibacter sp.]|nr:GHKL domain-containing protein [Oscillibacter sp.]
MSETGSQIFGRVLPVGAQLLSAACLTWFLRPFMARRGKSLLFLCLLYLLVGLLDERLSAVQGTLSLFVTVLLVAAAGLLGLEKKQAFLLAVLFWNTKTAGGLTLESLFFLAEQWRPIPADPVEAMLFRSAVRLVLLLLSHTALLTVMLYPLQRQMQKRRLPLRRRELCYVSLIPIAGILFGQIVSRLLFEVRDGIYLQLYERHPAFIAAVPLLALLFYAGTWLTIVFQQGMAALQEEQAASFAERQQIQAIRARIHEVEQFYTSVRELKHEMRGHLTNIKGLACRGAYASLDDYIARMDESMSGFELTLQTGNPVTDVIVNDTRRRSLDLGIRFQADFHYPEAGGFDAFDVGIILQNLLQNATEACEKVGEGERSILLAGKRKGRFFLIEVKNSFAGEVVFGQNGLPATTKKEDVPMHGIGLSNVRREAEKYMGEVEIKAENQTFRVTVLLQEKHL